MDLNTTWKEAVDRLQSARLEGVEEFANAVSELDAVVKSGATALHQFDYLRFEPCHDKGMRLADIAGVFTQDDYKDAVNELFVNPANMAATVQQQMLSDPALASLLPETPEELHRLSQLAFDHMALELGDRPADLDQRLKEQEVHRATSSNPVFRPRPR